MLPDLSAHHQQEVLAILSDRLSQSDGKGFKFGGAKHLVDPNSKESTTVLYEVFKKFPQARDDDERSAASALFIRFVNLLSSVQDVRKLGTAFQCTRVALSEKARPVPQNLLIVQR